MLFDVLVVFEPYVQLCSFNTYILFYYTHLSLHTCSLLEASLIHVLSPHLLRSIAYLPPPSSPPPPLEVSQRKNQSVPSVLRRFMNVLVAGNDLFLTVKNFFLLEFVVSLTPSLSFGSQN